MGAACSGVDVNVETATPSERCKTRMTKPRSFGFLVWPSFSVLFPSATQHVDTDDSSRNENQIGREIAASVGLPPPVKPHRGYTLKTTEPWYPGCSNEVSGYGVLGKPPEDFCRVGDRDNLEFVLGEQSNKTQENPIQSRTPTPYPSPSPSPSPPSLFNSVDLDDTQLTTHKPTQVDDCSKVQTQSELNTDGDTKADTEKTFPPLALPNCTQQQGAPSLEIRHQIEFNKLVELAEMLEKQCIGCGGVDARIQSTTVSPQPDIDALPSCEIKQD